MSQHVARPTRAGRLRPARWIAGLSVLALLAGCGGGLGGHAAPARAPAGTAPLSELTVLEDARSFHGPSTAALADVAIDPIAEEAQPDLPVTVTDMQGTTVTVTDASRILALDLYGSLARIAFELGLGDRLVGRDISTAFAEAHHLPLVTQNGHELNGEAILGLSPTVILTDTSLGPWDVVLQMRDAGIPVVVLDPKRDIDSVGSLIRDVAAALGVPDEGELLAERTERSIDEVRAQIDAIAPSGPDRALRMMFLYIRGSSGVYYVFGRGSGADSLIEALGGIDVTRDIGWSGMRPANDEGIVAAAPDLLIVMTEGLASAGGVDGLLERLPALAHTPAGTRRRVVDMTDTEVLSFGPNTAAVLDALARAIYAPEPTT